MRVRLLGPIEVTSNGGARRITGRLQRALLALLALEPHRTWSSDHLAELLWGEHLPVDAPAALRSQVSRLRRAMGDIGGCVLTDAGGYHLEVAPGDVDHLEMRRLLDEAARLGGEAALACVDSALALSRGRPFDDLDDIAPLAAARAELEALHLAARHRRGDLLAEVGKPDQAVAVLLAVAADAPDHEGVVASLARAFATAGRAREALDVIHGWRRRAREDHGLEPSPSLDRLELDILTNAPGAVRSPTRVDTADDIDVLVGRDIDVVRCEALLSPGSVTTLTGPGGVGKTRLAREVATRWSRHRRQPLVTVDVGALSVAADVVRALAEAFGIDDVAHRRLLDVVVETLQGRHAVLLIDGCEHLHDGVAQAVEAVLASTRTLTIVATSRERLGVPAERVWEVTPLGCEPHGPAVALFVQRLRATLPGSRVTEDDDHLIAAICTRLDGLPLAIELAAVAARAYPLEELGARLDDRFAILTSGPRHRPGHRSLRAMVDSSYDVLDRSAQTMLRRISVFAGDFDTEAALAVCPEGTAATLLQLVDRSLVIARRGRPAAFALLDTIRAYGRRRMEESNELQAARRDHATWARDLCREMSRAMSSSDERAVADRVALHLDDVRAAHDWLVGADPPAALELVTDLRTYALTRESYGLYRLAEVSVAAASEGVSAAAGWNMVAAGAWRRGDLAAADDAVRAALAVDPDGGSRRHGREARAEVALLRGEAKVAAVDYLAAAELALAEGDRFSAVWDLCSGALAEHYVRPQSPRVPTYLSRAEEVVQLVTSPSATAFFDFARGEVLAATDPHAAIEHLYRARVVALDVGATFIAGLADVALAALLGTRGEVAAADHYAAAISRWRSAGIWGSQWVTLRSLIGLLADVGDAADAAMLWGAERNRRRGSPAYGKDAWTLSTARDRLVASLGHDEFVRITNEGALLDDDALVDLAMNALEALKRPSPTREARRPRSALVVEGSERPRDGR